MPRHNREVNMKRKDSEGNHPFRYAEEVTVHGIREAMSSPVRWHRVAWLVIILLASVCMGFQLRQVAIAYGNDSVGSRSKSYVPGGFPGALFCPQFNYFKTGSGITEEAYEFISGYHIHSVFYTRWLDGAKDPASPGTKADVYRRIRAVNNSYERFLLENTLDAALILSSSTVPKIGLSTIQSNIATTAGYCKFVEINANLTKAMSEYVGFRVFPNVSKAYKAPRGTLHKVFIGDSGTVAFQPPMTSQIKLNRGMQYYVKVRVTEKHRYPGRNGRLCRDYDRSDQIYCMNQIVNRDYCYAAKCQQMAYHSTSFAEVPTDPESICNAWTEPYCMIFLAVDAEAVKRIESLCPEPCVQMAYDSSVQQTPCAVDDTEISVMWDNLALSTVIEEYPLVTLSDFLSALGGTVGLYCGASLLSVMQVLFYIFGAPCGCCTKKKCSGCRSGNAYRWS